MPRKRRIEIEGGVYHVYNRVASGEKIFCDPEEVLAFLDLIRRIKKRDGWTLFAWCVMSNHYHLAIRTSAIPLWRGMHHLMSVLASRAKRSDVAEVRKTIATLGVERWRQRPMELAKVLNKNPDFVSWLVGEGARRRLEDPEFANLLDQVDKKLEGQIRRS